MRLDIRGRHFSLTPALIAHVDRRVRTALGRFATCIDRVTTRLGDANGPRGGVDKWCRITLHLPPADRAVIVHEADADLYAAIDRAAERAARAIERCLARRAA